ncbi:DUF1007 family protein [Loktanella sp. Alg231-35]|uniref:DUF1007 family protein n=1 Tax=Loktanella sp. Alg231-35 TaxID=1922220 RepID=UPI00131EDBE0|nr:DUF1007 family protein [Loktanella sp. Alg231-35]
MSAGPAAGHPHVFVDGGVNFVFDDNSLVALDVTWLYDDFETLYMLSSYNLSLNAEGELDEIDRRALVQHRSNWPSDFDGSAHLTVGGQPVSLQWPRDLDAQIVDGRLRVTFTRDLHEAVGLADLTAEVAFYESTYFYAFTITEQPQFVGSANRCSEEVFKYEPAAQDQEMQATLSRLNREETPAMADVGALFADRIVMICA